MRSIDTLMAEGRAKPPTDAAERAYRDGRLLGTLIIAVRKARVAFACGDVGAMTAALTAVTAAESAAGVDLTTPTDEDLGRKAVPKRSSKDRRDPPRIASRRRVRALAPSLHAFLERATVGGPGPRPTRLVAEEELARLEAVVAAVIGQEAVPPARCWGYDPRTARCRCQLHRAIEKLLNPTPGAF